MNEIKYEIPNISNERLIATLLTFFERFPLLLPIILTPTCIPGNEVVYRLVGKSLVYNFRALAQKLLISLSRPNLFSRLKPLIMRGIDLNHAINGMVNH